MPISFLANVVRVVVLALVTYYLGDEAGQGFIHGFSGMVLFVVALVLTVAADSGVRKLSSWLPQQASAASHDRSATGRVVSARRPNAARPRVGALWPSVGWLGAAAGATVVAWALTPPLRSVAEPPDLEAAIPSQFGDWKRVDLPAVTVDVVPQGPGEKSTDRPYDSVVLRAYANSKGDVVGLAVAYTAAQQQEVKVHRPELCYAAQGFSVLEQSAMPLMIDAGAAVPGRRLYVENRSVRQAVSYFIRIGEKYPQSPWALRGEILASGLLHRSSDGVLVRASSAVDFRRTQTDAHALNERFLADLLAHLNLGSRALLMGLAASRTNG